MTAFDLYAMSTQASKHKLFHAAVIFLRCLTKKLKTEDSHTKKDYTIFWNFKMNYSKAKQNLKTAIKFHDEELIKRGPFGIYRRLNSQPLSAKLRKKSLPSNEPKVIPMITNRSALFYYKESTNFNTTEGHKTFLAASTIQANKLCIGGKITVRLKNMQQSNHSKIIENHSKNPNNV